MNKVLGSRLGKRKKRGGEEMKEKRWQGRKEEGKDRGKKRGGKGRNGSIWLVKLESLR